MTTHERAVEVDTALAALWERENKADYVIDSAFSSLHFALGHKQNWSRRSRAYEESREDTEAQGRAVLANPDEATHYWVKYDGRYHLATYGEYIKNALKEIDKARADALAARAEAQPLEAEYDAERWPRFFLVMNVGGHVHKDRQCKTTFPTTQWSWLPNLSGLGEDAAVADQGPRLCSVCYPSAPVEWTLGLPKKYNPKRCDGSSQQATDIDRRYYTARGHCPVCGTNVTVSSTGKARPHNKPEGVTT